MGVGAWLAVASVAASGPASVEELAAESEASKGGEADNVADGAAVVAAAGVGVCARAAPGLFAVPLNVLFEAMESATEADPVVPVPGSLAVASAALRAAEVSSASRAGLLVALALEASLPLADAEGVVPGAPVPARSGAFEPAAVVETAADGAAAAESAVAESVAFSV
jgi:hypothetical protein